MIRISDISNAASNLKSRAKAGAETQAILAQAETLRGMLEDMIRGALAQANQVKEDRAHAERNAR